MCVRGNEVDSPCNFGRMRLDINTAPTEKAGSKGMSTSSNSRIQRPNSP